MANPGQRPSPNVIDLRSDTVTRPTVAMLEAMTNAEVGDDVLGDDPTVMELESRIADLFGKDDACFVPSGSMANLVAIRAQTEPGCEIIGAYGSHFYEYEAGSFAAAAGCSVRLIRTDNGIFTADDVTASLRHPDYHFPVSRMLVIENTHNKGGGTVWTLDQMREVTDRAREHGLVCHLDGARLMNACVASGLAPADYADCVDTISTCFSKGLGAPVGSAVVGTAGAIDRVKRYRKMFGGTMRQSGLLAAAAIYALDHNVDRLAEDHANAQHLAHRLSGIEGITIDIDTVHTNMVFFEVDEQWGTGAAFCDALNARDVWMFDVDPQRVRAVTHLDVTRDQVDEAADRIAEVLAGSARR